MADDPDLDPDLEPDEPVDPEPDEPTDPEPDEPAEPEPDEPAEPEPPEPGQSASGEQPRPPSRRDARIETLRVENQRKDQELADLRRRLDTLTQPAPAIQPQETPAQRAARHATMTPLEVMQETLAESENRHSQQLQSMQMAVMDSTDKSAYEARAAVDPLYSRWMPKVEAKLAEMRNHPDPRQRASAPREVILKFLIGEAMLAKRGSKEGQQVRAKAARRVAGQKVRPGNSSSDVAAQRGRRSSLEERLENIRL